MSKATIIWKSIGTGLVACLLIGAVVWGYRMAPTDEPCVSLEINISDQDERMYLSETELTGLLQTADLYPVGRKQDLVSLHRIEQAIRQHPMVRTAECYMTPRREVKIKLAQRVPLLLVSKADELYFIDTDRRVMPFRERVKDKVLKVTGTVSKQAAATQLCLVAARQQLLAQPHCVRAGGQTEQSYPLPAWREHAPHRDRTHVRL